MTTSISRRGAPARNKASRAAALALAALLAGCAGPPLAAPPTLASRASARLESAEARSAKAERAVVLSPANRALVARINAKLRRYVRRSGKCGPAREQLATFYWQGRRTANGEKFLPDGLTAASRHLPFGTVLTVRNPHNGRVVVVRINDRGPFTDAELDLSRGAARALGLRQSSYVCVN